MVNTTLIRHRTRVAIKSIRKKGWRTTECDYDTVNKLTRVSPVWTGTLTFWAVITSPSSGRRLLVEFYHAESTCCLTTGNDIIGSRREGLFGFCFNNNIITHWKSSSTRRTIFMEIFFSFTPRVQIQYSVWRPTSLKFIHSVCENASATKHITQQSIMFTYIKRQTRESRTKNLTILPPLRSWERKM